MTFWTNPRGSSWSGRYYALLSQLLGLVPIRRYALATRLMRAPALRTAPVQLPQGRWVVIPTIPSTWALPFGLKEPAVQRHLGRLLEAADSFIDCGANLGWYSFVASRKANLSHVVAVEPIRQSVAFIALIKAVNDLRRLDVVRGCASDHTGSVRFTLHDERFSEHGEVVAAAAAGQDTAEVASYTLEHLIGRVPEPLSRICVKIDVEGHERAVLASARPETLSRRVSSLLIEAHLYKFARPREELAALCELAGPVGPVAFLMLDPALHPGYRRLWMHVTGRYPLERRGIDAVAELVERHRIPELFIIARRNPAA